MNSKVKNVLKDYIIVTLGTLILCLGVYFFKFPNNFSTGGVSGLAVIFAKAFPDFSSGQLVFIMNFSLIIVGFLLLGKDFGGKTVYCSLLMSGFLTGFEIIWPMSAPLTNQPLMELVFAVIIPSLGSAILFHNNASTGGMEVIAMMLRKYTKLNIGSALLVTDVLIALSTLFVFGIETGMFSILGLLSKSLVVDQITNNFTLSKNCIIITDVVHYNDVCTHITAVLGRGATVIDAKGYYTNDDKKAIISVVRKRQLGELRDEINKLDPNAFLLVTDTNQAFGRGFASI